MLYIVNPYHIDNFILPFWTCLCRILIRGFFRWLWSSGQYCAISCKKAIKFPGFLLVPVSESIMAYQWPLYESPCFPSKCMVLAIHFKITGYTLKRESLVLSVCTGIVFSGASKRWINLTPCSIAFWWYEFVRWRFSFSILLCHCEYPLSMNEPLSFPWMSGNNVQ